MKKSLLFISALFLGSLSTNAQITITSADIASPVKVIQQAHDTMPTILIGSAGPSMVWNFNSLNTHTLDTLNFISPSWAPQASKFPTSNLAAQFVGQNAYAYLLNNATGLTILGQSAMMDFGGGPQSIIQKSTPAEILTKFPSTYLTNFTNTYTTNGTFGFNVSGIDSIRQKSMVTKTSNVDAWGNVTMPFTAAFFASLRYYEVKHQKDSTWFFVSALGGWQTSGPYAPQGTIDSSKSYSWWANGIGFPLVTAQVDYITGAVKNVDWLKTPPTAGINEFADASGVNVYPNPAQNEITFAVESAKVISIRVFDVAGRMINSYPVSSDNASINISAFSNGAYMYSVIGKDNAVLNRGKFTIAK